MNSPLRRQAAGHPREAHGALMQCVPMQVLAKNLQVGDILFTRLQARPFREAADVMLTWTNHVGVVVSTHGDAPVVAESVLPVSRRTRLAKVLARSVGGRVAVKRLPNPLTAREQIRLEDAVRQRMGVLYDGGFNLDSGRQFCSKFVREVMCEATGQQLGEVETLSDLFQHNPHAKVWFWRLWYLGRIPWSRRTVTPISLMLSPGLQTVFDGHVRWPSGMGKTSRPNESGWGGVSSLPTG